MGRVILVANSEAPSPWTQSMGHVTLVAIAEPWTESVRRVNLVANTEATTLDPFSRACHPGGYCWSHHLWPNQWRVSPWCLLLKPPSCTKSMGCVTLVDINETTILARVTLVAIAEATILDRINGVRHPSGYWWNHHPEPNKWNVSSWWLLLKPPPVPNQWGACLIFK